jgi:4-hydroxybenzoate polyprenyltransferase
MISVRSLFESIRPKQWIKNLIVFAALIFSLNVFHATLVLRSFLAFFLFCIASSAVYLFNDILDIKQDRLHPLKSQRPIASGRFLISHAIRWSIIFLLVAVVGGFLFNTRFGWVILTYLTLQYFYSRHFKHVVILDVMIIAIGFVLRAIAGAFVIDVEISFWLLITTFLLALFLGFGKRRHEITILNDQANAHRAVLSDYSPIFLDQMISIVTASTVIVYMLYTTSEEAIVRFGSHKLIYTIPFVLYGIFRYLYLIHKKDRGGDPSKTLLTDLPLLIDVALWVLAVVAIIYHSLS